MIEFVKYIERILASFSVDASAIVLIRHFVIIALTLLAAWFGFLVCRRIVAPIVVKITRKTDVKWDDTILSNKVLLAACHVIPAVVVYYMLPLAFYDFPILLSFLLRLGSIYITITMVKLILVIISSLKIVADDGNSSSHQYLVSLISVLKIIIIFIAVIIVIAIIIDKNPLTLFAGLGATATILMLVFKDTIEGLVSGIRLASNDMVRKGDWITYSKAGADGVVEEISLTTVKIRNFDNTIITVPPQTLVDDSFQNWKGMQESEGRRVKRKVYFDFRSVGFIDDTIRASLKDIIPEDKLKHEAVNMTLFRRYVEQWLLRRNEVNKEMLLMVRQLEATNTGLPVEFYFFLKDKEWSSYEHQLADIMEQIYAFAPKFGLKIYQQFTEK